MRRKGETRAWARIFFYCFFIIEMQASTKWRISVNFVQNPIQVEQFGGALNSGERIYESAIYVGPTLSVTAAWKINSRAISVSLSQASGWKREKSKLPKNLAMVLLAAAAVGPHKTLNPTLSPPSSGGRRPRLRFPLPLPRGGHLRCSAGYREAAAAAASTSSTTTTPRPTEIPWSRELCNSVRLIGTVGTEVELRQLPSGGSVARGRLAIWKSATETTW